MDCQKKLQYLIVIAMFRDWIKNLDLIFQLIRSKTKRNFTWYAWFLTCFEKILIASSCWFLLLQVFVVITLVLGFSTVIWKCSIWYCLCGKKKPCSRSWVLTKAKDTEDKVFHMETHRLCFSKSQLNGWEKHKTFFLHNIAGILIWSCSELKETWKWDLL